MVDIESQREPLCSPVHLPEASRCSYCDLWPLNALCFPTPGRRRVQVSGCCSAVPGHTGGSYKGFFFGWGGGERNVYNSSLLDELFINGQFTVHRNMRTSHENETEMG